MSVWDPTPEAVERAVTSTLRMRSSEMPQWLDAKKRLRALGIDVNDVVLAEWEPEGEHLMCGIIVSRDEKVFNFCVVYDYDAAGRPLEKGEGWINAWKEIPPRDIGLTSSGYPNSWAYAVIIARLVLESDAQT